jgi:hypothetical protein
MSSKMLLSRENRSDRKALLRQRQSSRQETTGLFWLSQNGTARWIVGARSNHSCVGEALQNRWQNRGPGPLSRCQPSSNRSTAQRLTSAAHPPAQIRARTSRHRGWVLATWTFEPERSKLGSPASANSPHARAGRFRAVDDPGRHSSACHLDTPNPAAPPRRHPSDFRPNSAHLLTPILISISPPFPPLYQMTARMLPILVVASPRSG